MTSIIKNVIEIKVFANIASFNKIYITHNPTNMEAEINQAIDSIIVESTDTIIEDNLLEDTTPEDTETNQIDQETLTKTINDLLEIVEELETSKNDLSASLSLNEELLASLTIEAETRQSTLEQLSSQIEELSEKASKIDEVDRLFNLISSHEII
jgi:chromosome segregation ATPase